MSHKERAPSDLEARHRELFRLLAAWSKRGDGWPLEQPSPLREVPSVISYGAYEPPILGETGTVPNAELGGEGPCHRQQQPRWR